MGLNAASDTERCSRHSAMLHSVCEGFQFHAFRPNDENSFASRLFFRASVSIVASRLEEFKNCCTNIEYTAIVCAEDSMGSRRRFLSAASLGFIAAACTDSTRQSDGATNSA